LGDRADTQAVVALNPTVLVQLANWMQTKPLPVYPDQRARRAANEQRVQPQHTPIQRSEKTKIADTFDAPYPATIACKSQATPPSQILTL
jgi:hypothetical protein